MKRFILHGLVPAIMPTIFFAIALTPVQVLGCRNRGLLALAVALLSGIAALVAAVTAIRHRRSGNTRALWWIISSLILTIPVVALLILA